jgi:hypothetical protein
VAVYEIAFVWVIVLTLAAALWVLLNNALWRPAPSPTPEVEPVDATVPIRLQPVAGRRP